MKKIIEYDIVWELTVEGLVIKVNDQIKQGWQPMGTFNESLDDHDVDGREYCQVLVKYED